MQQNIQQNQEQNQISQDKKQLFLKREENQVEIRKNQRDFYLNQNRKHQIQKTQKSTNIYDQGIDITYPEQNDNQNNNYNNQDYSQQDVQNFQEKAVTEPKILQEYINIIKSNNNQQEILKAIKILRLSTSYQDCPTNYLSNMKIVQENHIVKEILQAFKNNQNNDYQREIIKLLLQYLSGTTKQTEQVLEAEIYIFDSYRNGLSLFDYLFDLYFRNKDLESLENVAFALGNIIGTKLEYKEELIKNNIFTRLIQVLNYYTNQNNQQQQINNLFKHIAWSLCTLTREDPPAGYEFKIDNIQFLVKLLINSQEEEFLMDIAWTILQIVKIHIKVDQQIGNTGAIQFLLQCNILQAIEKLIQKSQLPLVLPALRMYSLLLQGEDQITKNILNLTNNVILKRIHDHVTHTMRVVRYEAIVVIGEIAQKHDQQIQQIVINKFIETIIYKADKDDQKVIQKCLEVINQVFQSFQEQKLYLLVNVNLYDVLRVYLSNSETDSANTFYSLSILESILKICIKQPLILNDPNKIEKVVKFIEEKELIYMVEEYQNNPYENIYKKSFNILDMYRKLEKGQFLIENGEIELD